MLGEDVLLHGTQLCLSDDVEHSHWDIHISPVVDGKIHLLRPSPSGTLSRAELTLLAALYQEYAQMDLAPVLRSYRECKEGPITYRAMLEAQDVSDADIGCILRELEAWDYAEGVLTRPLGVEMAAKLRKHMDAETET